MDTLQFSLFFVALLVGYALVHLRMIRFEEHLQKLAGIRGLDDRLKALDDRLAKLTEAWDRSAFERVCQQLQRLHEDLEDLREATVDNQRVVLPARGEDDGEGGPRGPALPPQQEPPAGRIVTRIETRLLQLGYRNLRLLGDLTDVQVTDEVEVQVEAERNGMPCKGRVVMRNGSVQDVSIHPVTQTFP
ncbi:MAG TPA: hypothetical protein ENI87_07055 [bacterium]|nr:hypothetical protein [bacterium]